MTKKNVCLIPKKVKDKEAKIYKSLIKHHCSHDDKESKNHLCSGVISISAKSIVFKCSKCGDAKGVF